MSCGHFLGGVTVSEFMRAVFAMMSTVYYQVSRIVYCALPCAAMFDVGDTCQYTRSAGAVVVATVVGPSQVGAHARTIKCMC